MPGASRTKGSLPTPLFFDYDRDGDLDCYLLNNSFRPVGGYDFRPGQREARDPKEATNCTANEGTRFVDVSEEAGIYGSQIGFGLGVTIGDVNRDGWQDIYVSNDFFERDYLYLNQQNGTFQEAVEEYIGELSLGSMGADMADLNHDGYPEIFVTDMLPEGDARMKTKTALTTGTSTNSTRKTVITVSSPAMSSNSIADPFREKTQPLQEPISARSAASRCLRYGLELGCPDHGRQQRRPPETSSWPTAFTRTSPIRTTSILPPIPNVIR
jgi:hypothetical protein